MSQELKIRDQRICYQFYEEDPFRVPVNTYSLVSYDVLITLSVATFFLLAYINYRVIRIVGAKDMVLVLMLVALKVALFSFTVFYGF